MFWNQRLSKILWTFFPAYLKSTKILKPFLKKSKTRKKKTKPIRASNIIRKTGTRVRLYQPHKALPKFIFRNYPNEKQNLLKHHATTPPKTNSVNSHSTFPKYPQLFLVNTRLFLTDYYQQNIYLSMISFMKEV